MNREVWIIEHSGLDAEDWFVWDSLAYVERDTAITERDRLEKGGNGQILKFRVKRYISNGEGAGTGDTR